MKEHSFKDVLLKLKDFFLVRLNINQERENDTETIESIRKGVDFKGTNLWVLICAILIACLGLNVNSTAVIIGAMLISPLMGPIMGFGLGLGINDFELFKKSVRNFGVATMYSIIASTLFFLISPISDAQSELLARTQPTIYDILIAFFGGCAGIIASCSKNKGNVIPGVAIATALMPPLCTAGFGLATGNLYFFFGALYLYFINTVFIALSTFFAVRLLKFPIKIQVDSSRQKKISRIVTAIVVCTIIPATFITYNMLRTNVFHTNANNFINKELSYSGSYIIGKELTMNRKEKTIKLLMVGKNIPEELIARAKSKLESYGLKGAQLQIQQGSNSGEEDIDALKNLVMKDFYEDAQGTIEKQIEVIDSLNKELRKYEDFDQLSIDILPEIKTLFPRIQEVSISRSWMVNVETGEHEPTTLVYLKTSSKLPQDKRNMLIEWMKARTDSKNLKLIEQ